MSPSLEVKMSEVSIKSTSTYERTPFGKEMLKHFFFDPAWKNLNHGAFGTFPRAIRAKQRELQDHCESAPDTFIRYEYPDLLDQAREAVSKILKCEPDTVVFVPNATTGVNIVLRNLVWNPDGKDEIIYFSHIYGACLKTIEYVSEANRGLVNGREITAIYPIEDFDLSAFFKDTIKASKSEGKRPRIAIFDTVSSLPGLRMPFEDLTKICKEEGILSLIDGAHGIGHIPLNLPALDPDFFVTNAHKWLYVPRGSAIFYTPLRNQHLMRSALPTSHGFVPKGNKTFFSPLPANKNSEFVGNFEFTGTIDNTNYLVAAEAIKWREEVCGGEEAIMGYNSNLALTGGKLVAKILGTTILDNESHTLTNCCLVNILLPLEIGEEKEEGKVVVKQKDVGECTQWLQKTLVDEFKTFIAIWLFQGRWWARLSGQVYLEIGDFEWAGEALKVLCGQAGDRFA